MATKSTKKTTRNKKETTNKTTARAVKATKSARSTRTTRAKASTARAAKKKTTTRATNTLRNSRATKPRVTPPARTEVEDEKFAGRAELTPESTQPLLSTGSGADWDFRPDKDVEEVLEETEETPTDAQELEEELSEHTDESPVLTGGDIDADWEDADDVGDETVGGTVSTPDKSRVDELGEAVGIVYQDEEPLDTEDKLERRDRHRWELNPSSDREQ